MSPLRLSERQFRQLRAGQPITRANKFGATKTPVDGIVFDSAFEAAYYRELKLRARAGDIRNLRWQVKYPLIVNHHRVGHYRADFVYDERRENTAWPTLDEWVTVIADTKSEPTRRTDYYRLKKRIMHAMGYTIREIVSPARPRRR